MSNLETQLHAKKDEQKEETSVLLRSQYTTFSEAYKVLQEHLEEFTTTEEVLHIWYSYYGQAFQQAWDTREHIKTIEIQQGLEVAMRSIVQYQIVLETKKTWKIIKTSSPMDESGTTQSWHIGQDFPTNEKIARHNRRKNSTVGNWHEQYHRPTNTREDVDSVKYYNLDH